MALRASPELINRAALRSRTLCNSRSAATDSPRLLIIEYNPPTDSASCSVGNQTLRVGKDPPEPIAPVPAIRCSPPNLGWLVGIACLFLDGIRTMIFPSRSIKKMCQKAICFDNFTRTVLLATILRTAMYPMLVGPLATFFLPDAHSPTFCCHWSRLPCGC